MKESTKNSIRSAELQRFSQNAAQLLLERGQLREFFHSLGYEVEEHGGGFRGQCPACLSSFCYVGVNGTHHRVYWKCYNRQCESNTGKSGLCRNLLGLVKGLVQDQHLGKAIEALAQFLGYQGRSWDITNGKFLPGPESDGVDEHIPF